MVFVKSRPYLRFAMAAVALVAARSAHAQPVGSFLVHGKTDPVTGEDRSFAMIHPESGVRGGGLMAWNCVAAGGVVVTLGLDVIGRASGVRPLTYRFDRDRPETATASRTDSLSNWYLSAEHVAPFTLRARRARRLVIRAPGHAGAPTEEEYVYDFAEAGQALDRLPCARGTPVPGRPLPYEERMGDGVAQWVPNERGYELSAVEVRPQLTNQPEIDRLLVERFPPALRGTGVTGRVVVRFRVLENGRVDSATVAVTESTHEAFDATARMVARRMTFTPAQLYGLPVRVWVRLPLSFQAGRAEADSAAAPPPPAP